VLLPQAIAVDFGTMTMQGRFITDYEFSCGVDAARTPAVLGLLVDIEDALP